MLYIAGTIGVVALMVYIISFQPIPPIGEFMASSTSVVLGIKADVSSTTPGVAPENISSGNESKIFYATTTIHVPKGDITAEISNTPDKRELGLSNRTSLGANSGMLFIFPVQGSYMFWMKDMHFPIDIVWINVDRKVVGIDSNISPDTYPEAFNSPGKVQFVLELNAGDAERFGIKEGTSLNF